MLATIPLSSLHVDRSISLRKSDCMATVRRYARSLAAGDHFPSLDVCIDENGEYWLADGFLRYDAHQLVGSTEVTVRVHAGGARAARIFACGANDLHGRQRTQEEKRAAVRRVIEDSEWGQWSDHLIADSCRVSHTFVAKMRARLAAGAADPPREPAVRTSSNGRRYTPRTQPAERTEAEPASPTAAAQAFPTNLRAIPTAPGLCELPRLPPRENLPPVDPQTAEQALDLLAMARDFLLATRGQVLQAQSLAPDPSCGPIADGIDQVLTLMLPWLARLDPHFEEEGRPPQLPRVLEAAANLPREQQALANAASQYLAPAPSAHPPHSIRPTPVAPPASPRPPAPPTPVIFKSLRDSPPYPVPVPHRPPAPSPAPATVSPDQARNMAAAVTAMLVDDPDALRQVFEQQQAAFAAGWIPGLRPLPPAASPSLLATLPVGRLST